MVKRLPAGDPGSIPELGRSPGEGDGKPTPVLLPGESHGWRSLVGYSPWSHKESDMTERLHFHFTSKGSLVTGGTFEALEGKRNVASISPAHSAPGSLLVFQV